MRRTKAHARKRRYFCTSLLDEEEQSHVEKLFSALCDGSRRAVRACHNRVSNLVTAVSGGGGLVAGDPLLVDVHAINDNNLNGLHVTYDGELLNTSLFVFNVFANAGVYHNQITNRLTESYISGPAGGTVYMDDIRVANSYGGPTGAGGG